MHEQYRPKNNKTDHINHERNCEDCGIVIAKKRLIANPQSVKCIHCQEDLEEELEFLSMIKRTWNEEDFSLWEEQWRD